MRGRREGERERYEFARGDVRERDMADSREGGG